MIDQELRGAVGLTEKQQNDLRNQLASKEDAAASLKSRQLQQETEKKLLAVIEPRQWKQLGQIFAGAADDRYPIVEFDVLSRPAVAQQLHLSDEQQTKLQAISDRSQSKAGDLLSLVDTVNNVLTAKEQQAKSVEFDRKMAALGKEDRRQIAAMLDEKQSAALKRLVLEHRFLVPWHRPDSSRAATISKSRPDFSIGSMPLRSNDKSCAACTKNFERAIWQQYRATGESVMKILSPQQQEKLIEATDRMPATPSGKPSRGGAEKTGNLTKIGVGTVTVYGPSGAADAAEPAKHSAPPATKNAGDGNKRPQ